MSRLPQQKHVDLILSYRLDLMEARRSKAVGKIQINLYRPPEKLTGELDKSTTRSPPGRGNWAILANAPATSGLCCNTPMQNTLSNVPGLKGNSYRLA